MSGLRTGDFKPSSVGCEESSLPLLLSRKATSTQADPLQGTHPTAPALSDQQSASLCPLPYPPLPIAPDSHTQFLPPSCQELGSAASERQTFMGCSF